MEINKVGNAIASFLKKNRYAALVLLIGIVLMILPARNTSSNDRATTEVKDEISYSVDKQLAEILSGIKGAGEVEVMLTVATGEEKIYQTDINETKSENDNEREIKTVIVVDASRNETALIRQVNPPRYLGAIIICQGADSPSVRLDVVDAVSKITGLGSDRISVLKMK